MGNMLYAIILILIILFIGTVIGILLLEKQCYDYFLSLPKYMAMIFTLLIVYLCNQLIIQEAFEGMPYSKLSFAVSVASILFGMYLLRKHYIIIIFPWVSSIILMLSVILLWLITYIPNYDNYWFLFLLYYLDGNLQFLSWGFLCVIITFIFVGAVTLYFALKKFKIATFIKYSKSNLYRYFFVALLPSAALLFCWFQYISLSTLFFGNILLIIIFVLLEIFCTILFLIYKVKTKAKSKIRIFIYVAANLLFASFLAHNRDYMGANWLISYYLLCFIGNTIYQVKGCDRHIISEKKVSKMNKIAIYLLSYFPLVIMVSCCLIIVALDRAGQFS